MWTTNISSCEHFSWPHRWMQNNGTFGGNQRSEKKQLSCIFCFSKPPGLNLSRIFGLQWILESTFLSNILESSIPFIIVLVCVMYYRWNCRATKIKWQGVTKNTERFGKRQEQNGTWWKKASESVIHVQKFLKSFSFNKSVYMYHL